MRVLRTLLVSMALLVGGGLVAPGAGAQTGGATTTTTIPDVRSIPVTPANPPTTAPQPQAASTAGSGLADTGVAADKLVPLGLALLAIGAAMQAAATRPRRRPYGLL